MTRIAFFEDHAADDLGPIALTRPVHELVCGQFSNRERIVRCLSVSDWGALIRPWLAASYREAQPEALVNDFVWLGQKRTLLLNGRWIPNLRSLDDIGNLEDDEVLVCDQTIVGMSLDPLEAVLLTEETWEAQLKNITSDRRVVESSGTLIRHPWDLVNQNGEQLIIDFQLRQFGPSQTPMGPHVALGPHASLGEQGALGQQVAVLGSQDQVYVDPTAKVEPFVVLDARRGPVTIDAGAVIESFTRLEGPCHIGAEAQLLRANVREGTTIGPVCRVGGEIEETILHGYVNKCHDGFLGHSYVGTWVNLGALTTNSDLKNDYSNVGVPLSGKMIDTGSKKVGSFIGDHTKTALTSLFNTGSSIGVMCMILPGGELLPKHIPSFCRVWHGELDDGLLLEQGLETARIVMGRRNQELTPSEDRLLRFLYEKTTPERSAAIERFRQKIADRREAVSV